ncbi:helix-hairpin-helix domain-containing protein [Promicromonospora sp. NPDC057488]|uniref:helix-hairpin-helix domain-containing protein n=1 Tax=Promicromonospora sp. NPDC057488 TaxID=3346147 RepID=UPI00366CDCD1
MQPETAQQRRPDPWPFGPVRGSDGPGAQPLSGAGPSATMPTAAMPSVAMPSVTEPVADAGPAADGVPDARTEADDLVERLRARRSTSGVAAAYAAAHGHPADPRAERGARRWALTGTTAAVAVVAVLLLGVGVAAFALRGDGVEALAPVGAGSGTTEAAPGTGDEGPGELASGADGDGAGDGGTDDGGADGDGAGKSAGASGGLLVHVVGEVAEPGLVTLPDGARVADAVQAAGGVTRKADLTAVNLARTVVDGEQLYVPKPGEPVPGAAAGAGGSAGGGTGGPAGGAGTGAVDINTADAAALEALPGVGPSIAKAIVEWRDTNGAFASVDELDDVPGIGPATLDELRDTARVGP